MRVLAAIGLAIAAGATAPAPPQPVGWSLSSSTDKLTDAVTQRAEVWSSSGELAVTCGGGRKPSVVFASAVFMANSPPARIVIYRLDDDPPVTETWRFYPNAASFGWDNGADRFIARLATAKRVRLRADDGTGATIDAEFDVTGAGDALRTLAAKCP